MLFGGRLVCHKYCDSEQFLNWYNVTNAFRREVGLSLAKTLGLTTSGVSSPMPFGGRLVCHNASPTLP